MNNWKIVGRIAIGFAVVCILFAIIAAFITYSGVSLNSGYPPEYMQLSVISSMLQYLFYAALAFVAARFCMGAAKRSAKAEAPIPEEQPAETPEEETMETPEEESKETET